MVKIRRPAVAGLFYESEPERLKEQIRQTFLHKLGPGKLPVVGQKFKADILGIVSPHAGYIYSGHVAAHGFYRLSESGKPDIVFILGPNHHGLGDPLALSTSELWETPLGTLEVDLEVSKSIIEKSKLISFDDVAHLQEHSIEVQLPFLQFMYDTVRIVPLSMLLQYPEAAKAVGEAIASVISEMNLKACIVASSDFTHYESADAAKRKDKIAIEKIINLDPEGLFNAVVETPISMCGPGPVMALIYAAKKLGYTKARLLKYANSGDVTGDYSAVVAYASIAFERE